MRYHAMTFVILTAAMGCLTHCAQSQLEGIVKDVESGSALSGVIVQLPRYNRIDTTDASGVFTFNVTSVKPGARARPELLSCSVRNGALTIINTRDADVRVDVFSMNGTRFTSARFALKAGRHGITPLVTAAGMYVYRIYSGKTVHTLRFARTEDNRIGATAGFSVNRTVSEALTQGAIHGEPADTVDCFLDGYYEKKAVLAWNTAGTVIQMKKITLGGGVKPGLWMGLTGQDKLISMTISPNGKSIDSLSLSVLLLDCPEVTYEPSFSIRGPIAIPVNGVVSIGDSIKLNFTDSSVIGSFLTHQTFTTSGSPPCYETVITYVGSTYIIQMVPRYSHTFKMYSPIAFISPAFALTVNADHGAVLTLPKQPLYRPDQTVTLIAIPDSSFRFSSWAGPTQRQSGDTAWVLMNGPQSITANFMISYTLTIFHEGGSVEALPKKAKYDPGETVRLIAKPDSIHCCPRWSGDTSRTSADTAWVVMVGPKSVNTNFVRINKLIVSATNGQIKKLPDKTQFLSSSADTVKLIAIADPGYVFATWVGPIVKQVNDTAWVVMNADVSVAATFTVSFIHTVYHDSAIRILSVALSPDGSTVALGADSRIALFDRNTGAFKKTLANGLVLIYDLRYSHDGSKLLAGSWAGNANLFDAATGGSLQTFTTASICYCAVFSPDESKVLTGSISEMKLWTIDGKEERSFPVLNGWVHSAAFSPAAAIIAEGALFDSTRAFDAQTGAQLGIFPFETKAFFFSPDGATFLAISTDGTIAQIDAGTGAVLKKVATGSYPECAAFSPDGSKVATGSWGYKVAVWETNTGKLLQDCVGHHQPVLSIAFSSDGKQFLTGSMDQQAILWDVK